MNTKKNSIKIPFTLSVFFLCISVSLFLFFYQTTNDNNKKAQTAEKEWQVEASRRDEIRTLYHSIQVIGEERSEIETHFARSSNIVPFLDTIEALAPRAGAVAEVTSVDILKGSPVLVVGMKASGTFSGLYEFLTLLENSPYELEFTGVDIQKETATDNKWDLTLNINLLSFVNQ
jgi:hypothetical protein